MWWAGAMWFALGAFGGAVAHQWFLWWLDH